MAKKKKIDLYQRPDGLYEKGLTINGKRIRFRGRDEKEILQKIAAYKEKAEKGLLFNEIADLWYYSFVAEHPASERYAKAHINRLKEYFAGVYASEITAKKLTMFFATMSGYAQNTVNNCRSVCSAIFGYAIAEGLVADNPVEYSKTPSKLKKSERRMPTQAELDIVKASVNKPYGLYPFFALYTGMRRGELLALKYKDIDFEKNIINVSKSIYHQANRPIEKETKTFRGTRQIILLDILKQHIPKNQPTDHYVFGGENPWTACAVQRHMETYRNHTKLTIGVHQLRHAYATILYEAGVDERMAMELLGHANISTTREIYTHISQSKQKDTATLLNSYINT